MGALGNCGDDSRLEPFFLTVIENSVKESHRGHHR
jgi:hypothetical protein